MLVIQKSTKELINDLMLHDAEVNDIIINYKKHTVTVPLRLESGANVVICFEKVQYCDVNIFEPWGNGFYINDVNIGDIPLSDREREGGINTSGFNTSILLNSGDVINIISSELIYVD